MIDLRTYIACFFTTVDIPCCTEKRKEKNVDTEKKCPEGRIIIYFFKSKKKNLRALPEKKEKKEKKNVKKARKNKARQARLEPQTCVCTKLGALLYR